MSDADTGRAGFEQHGCLWFRRAIDTPEIEHLKQCIEPGTHPGHRVDREHPLFRAVAGGRVTETVRSVWPAARPVRVLAFNKTDASNWQLGWHQDRVIAVDRRVDLPGFGAWSLKSGIWHCEPPESVLSNMLFVRVHLDEHTRANGGMEIAVGSHREGRILAAEASRIAGRYPVETTVAEAGDALVLAMHTLHRSPAAQDADARATLRVDFALAPLPAPLQWA
ncbi:phytanoyl-CoA dioxygenase family protein [Nitrogeniibacter aestuarii]|uniref:phytanoyl-CoA dioxygenase family protein n=1 Tax=Nitrogeniibacter aestuarii TaxID=2815343 RepID=UPI001E5E0E6B|nr:phytanoyl-CoA dioxygenase family protein [Nitrogeniibacter aestuarii]